MPKKQKKDESHPDEAEPEAKAIVDEVFANAVHISDRRSKAIKKDIHANYTQRMESTRNFRKVEELRKSTLVNMQNTLKKHDAIKRRQRFAAKQEKRNQEKMEALKKRQDEFSRFIRDHKFNHFPHESMQITKGGTGYDRSLLLSEHPTFMDGHFVDTLVAPRRSHSRSKWRVAPQCEYATKPFSHLSPLIVLNDEKYNKLLQARRKAILKLNDEKTSEEILQSFTRNEQKVVKRAMDRIREAFERKGGSHGADLRSFKNVAMFPVEFRNVIRTQLGVVLNTQESMLVFKLFDRDDSGTVEWTEVVLKFYGKSPRMKPWYCTSSTINGPFNAITPLHTQSDEDYHKRLTLLDKARKRASKAQYGAVHQMSKQEALAHLTDKEINFLKSGVSKLRVAFFAEGGAEHADLRAFQGMEMLPSEFKRLMKSNFNVVLSPSETNAIVKYFDRDNSKTLSFAELRAKLYGDNALLLSEELLQESLDLRRSGNFDTISTSSRTSSAAMKPSKPLSKPPSRSPSSNMSRMTLCQLRYMVDHCHGMSRMTVMGTIRRLECFPGRVSMHILK
eukprot:g6749.t1